MSNDPKNCLHVVRPYYLPVIEPPLLICDPETEAKHLPKLETKLVYQCIYCGEETPTQD